jgi:molecular chaperone GrpE (heat shock protein)
MAKDKDAKEPKQVSVHVSRALVIQRHEKEPVRLIAGRNVVDEDVAAHPLVKAHTTDAPVEAADVKALEAENAALRKQVEEQAAAIAALRKRVEEQAAVIAAYEAAAGAKK